MIWGCTSTSSFSAGMPKMCMRLDQFEALVHQAGGIDGDLRPHRPVGMGQRLFRRRGGDLFRAPGRGRGRPRRSATCFRSLSMAFAAEGLEDGVVLGIHRQDLHPISRALRMKAFAGADEAFLVGEGHVAARPRRRRRSARRRRRRRWRRRRGRPVCGAACFSASGPAPASIPEPDSSAFSSSRRRDRQSRRSARRGLWRPGRGSWRRGRPPPRRPRTRPGAPRITASVERPMEPVAPRMVSFLCV